MPDLGSTYLDWAQRDPVGWCERVLGRHYEDYQKDILESIRDHRKTVVRACHAPGKTFTAASAALWSLFSWPNSLVITSAPTWRQVEDQIWGDLRDLYNNATIHLGGNLLPRAPRLELGDKWRCFGVSTREKEQFQGYHNARILIILDEHPGIKEDINEAIRGIEASGDIHLLLLGNPTKPYGSFYDAFGKARELYNCIHLSCWDTPNFKGLKAAYDDCKTLEEKVKLLRAAPMVNKYLINAQWVAQMLIEFGEDSDVFRVRALGEFPRGGPDTLIPLHLAEQAAIRWMEYHYGKTNQHTPWWESEVEAHMLRVGALDVARFGEAESVLGSRLEDILAPLDCWNGLSVPNLAGYALERIQSLSLSRVLVDEVGLGGGPLDLLELQIPNVYGFKGGDPALHNTNRFANLNAEAYWGLRSRFYEGRIMIPNDPVLIGQLSSIRYFHKPDMRLGIESKEDAVKRGLRHRDRADGVMMAYHCEPSMEPPVQVRGQGTDWSRMQHGHRR